jgi:hypothetical protein
MPSTQPYSPTFNFPSDPAPQRKINDVAMQAELQSIAANLAALIAALSSSIAPDNGLTDALVRLRNLHPELRTYLDSALTGTVLTQSLTYRLPVRVASTANVVNLYGAQTIDGVALVSQDFVLLKDQTVANQNGLWEVRSVGDAAPHAAGLWTRRSDLPAALPSGTGWATCVSAGTVNGQTAWAVLTGGTAAEQPVVGAGSLVFLPVFGVFPVPVARGGTGATTSAGARTSLAAAGKYVTTVTGDAVQQSFGVTHGLGASFVLVGVQDVDFIAQAADYEAAGVNAVTITFQTPPAIGEVLTITVIG